VTTARRSGSVRIRDRLDVGLEVATALLMAIVCVVVFLGVVFRYVLLNPLTWTEEVARLCLVWITFLGTYLAYRRRLHIAIDVISVRLTPGARRAIHFVVTILLAVLMATLVVQGSQYSRAFLGSATPLLGIPLGVVYAALPLSAALLLIAVLAELLDLLRGRALVEESAKGDTL
jgi:TRAP-type C4-dicarboxylate transport system permease small subunit